jgi:glycosyltransferase involved in cell wall biosynthesis
LGGVMTKGKVVFATPSLSGPTAPYMEALIASVPGIKAAGWDAGTVHEVGCPYISNARATMLRKALDAGADVIVFIDYDLSWKPGDLLKLIETPGDVVAGTYRYKEEEPHYMGILEDGPENRPVVRDDGAIYATAVPAGFLKVTKEAVDRFMTAYPELMYGPKYAPSVDLFNHGAFEGQWWGEDYAFCRRWRAIGGEVLIVPNLDLNHHSGETVFEGNFHEFLMRQPGGSKA